VIIFSFSARGINAAGYDFYVDAGSAEASEDGSEAVSIQDNRSRSFAYQNSSLKSKTIFVKKGTYWNRSMLRTTPT